MQNNECFIVEGLGGQKILNGSLEIGMSKNTLISAFALAFLYKNPVKFSGVEYYSDINKILKIIKESGASVKKQKNSVTIDTSHIKQSLNIDIRCSQSRYMSLTGPLLVRFGKIEFILPRGCSIGERPINFFVDIYRSMGASVTIKEQRVYIEVKKKLCSIKYKFPNVSVQGTIAGVLTASMIDGISVFSNCSLEPEVTQIFKYLIDSGVKIDGIETQTVTVYGTASLLESRVAFKNLPDRIQTANYLLMCLLTCKNIILKNCANNHNQALYKFLNSIGVKNFEINNNQILIKKNDYKSIQKNIVVQTGAYPDIPTDTQTMLCLFLTQIQGRHKVVENIYESRLERQLAELNKFGAKCEVINNSTAYINGITNLKGAVVNSIDLRCGFALIIAGLLANGQSQVCDANFIDRGYNNIVKNICSLGGSIKRNHGSI